MFGCVCSVFGVLIYKSWIVVVVIVKEMEERRRRRRKSRRRSGESRGVNEVMMK